MSNKMFPTDKRAANSNRRGEEERRAEPPKTVDEERRLAERRTVQDRRMRIHTLYVSTRMSVSELEDFLDSKCQDYWSAVFLETDKQAAATRFVLQFVTLEDRNRVTSSIPENGIL